MSEGQLPTFAEAYFLFDDDDSIPSHIDALPKAPHSIGRHAVFGCTEGGSTYPLAYDVPNEAMAHLLAQSRADMQKQSVQFGGYVDDVYVWRPDGSAERVHRGKAA